MAFVVLLAYETLILIAAHKIRDFTSSILFMTIFGLFVPVVFLYIKTEVLCSI